jgi:hypothetical protein
VGRRGLGVSVRGRLCGGDTSIPDMSVAWEVVEVWARCQLVCDMVFWVISYRMI